MDLCENIKVGDILFARVPYKFFTLFEASNWNGNYVTELSYTKSANILSKTVNKVKCKRIANKKNGYDLNYGSTIGGSYGYGFAKDSSKDILPTLAPKPQSGSTS
jgi:hypothetical protein